MDSESNPSSFEYHNALSAAAEYVLERCGWRPQLGIVLGSGLGGFVDAIEDAIEIPYTEVPFMPVGSVKGHASKIVLGTLPNEQHGALRVLCLAGRVHAYEGIDEHALTFSCRMAALCGVKLFVVTNSAGGAQRGMTPGDFAIITDYVKFATHDPLLHSSHDARFGPRHWRAEEPFSTRLRSVAHDAAKAIEMQRPLWEGTYCWTSGPTYETPSEVKAGIKHGATLFGMSTVPETMAASAMGMEVFGFSMVTNVAAGLSDDALDHADVTLTARTAGATFTKLVREFTRRLSLQLQRQPEKLADLPPPPQSWGVRVTRPDWPSIGQCHAVAAKMLHNNAGLQRPSVLLLAPQCDSTSVFLQKLTRRRYMSLQEVPYMRAFARSDSARFGSVVFGTVPQSNRRLMVVRASAREGFTCEETALLLQSAKILGVRTVVHAFGAACRSARSGQLLVLQDYMDRAHGFVPMNADPSLGTRVLNKEPTMFSEHLTSLALALEDTVPGAVVAFPGPSMPSPAELKAVEMASAQAWTVTSLAPLTKARMMGLRVLALASLMPASEYLKCGPLHDRWQQVLLKLLEHAPALQESVTMSTSASSEEGRGFVDCEDDCPWPEARPVPPRRDVITAGYANRAIAAGDLHNFGQGDFDQVQEAVAWLRYSLRLRRSDSLSTAVLAGASFQDVCSGELSPATGWAQLNAMPHWRDDATGGPPGFGDSWRAGLAQLSPTRAGDGSVHESSRASEAERVLVVTSTKSRHFWNLSFLVRVLSGLGVQRVIFVSEVCAARDEFQLGDVVCLNDHVNMSGKNPLFGPNESRWGIRFIDMSQPYDPLLREKADASVKKLRDNGKLRSELDLGKTTVAASVAPPTLDSKCEARFCSALGAGATMWGTVPEVIVARHMSMRCLVLAHVSRSAAPAAAAADAAWSVEPSRDVVHDLRDVITHMLSQD